MTEENLKWMYEGKNSSIDHEQYLLGKKITSLADDEKDKGDFIVKQQSSIATGNVTVLEKLDYESKVREDPLFQIRKNDYEHRKELMSNPLKQKRIQNMLKNALEHDLKKKAPKQRKYSSSSSADSSDSDSSSDGDKKFSKKISNRSLQNDKLREALKRQLENDLKGKKTKKSYSHDDDKSQKSHKHSHRRRNKDKYYDSKRRNSVSEDDKQYTSSKKSRYQEKEKRVKYPAEHSPERVEKPGYGLIIVKDGERSSAAKPKRRRERRTPSPEPEKAKYVRKHKSGFSRKLTEEELEKKRREMMSNASWRDDQRKDNIEKYAQEEKREKEQEEKVYEMKRKAEKRGGKAKDFLHDMKLHSASVGSLEDTVRRKKHTLSRKL